MISLVISGAFVSKFRKSETEQVDLYYFNAKRGKLLYFRRNRLGCKSDSAYSYTFFCLSVVCLSHSCICVNRMTDFKCRLADTRCVRWGHWAPKGRDLGSNPQPEHAVANSGQTVSPLQPPGEYKRGVGWTCHSDSAFCQITLVVVNHCISSIRAGMQLFAATVWPVGALEYDDSGGQWRSRIQQEE